MIDVHIKDLNWNTHDTLTELYRSDWKDKNCKSHPIKQILKVTRKPNEIRAWHRHVRGQYDYFIVLSGRIRFCAYDPKTKELVDTIFSSKSNSLVRVNGKLWHGYQVVGNSPATILYFINNLYNYNKPDEQRLPHDSKIVKPKLVNGEKPKKKWSW